MPLAFLWAVPHSWLCNTNLRNAAVSVRPSRPTYHAPAATASKPQRAVTTEEYLSLDSGRALGLLSLNNHSQDLPASISINSRPLSSSTLESQPDRQHYSTASDATCSVLSVPVEALANAAYIHNTPDTSTQHSGQHPQKQPKAETDHTCDAETARDALLTAKLSSTANHKQLYEVIKQNATSINSIHVTAGFKALLSLQQKQHSRQQQAQLQDDSRAAAAVLLRLASRHASSLTAGQRGYILWIVTELGLHPWARWYRSMLTQQQQLQGTSQAQKAANSNEAGTISLNAIPADGNTGLVEDRLLIRLIKNAGSLKELKAILQPCWAGLAANHVLAALQQLLQLQQLQHKQQSGNAKQQTQQQQQPLQALGLQLLQCVVPMLQQLAGTSSAGSDGVYPGPAAHISPHEAAALLRAAAALQLQLEAEQVQSLLLQVLQHVSTGAEQLSGFALVDLVTGVAGLLQQQQQLQQQQLDQQQQAAAMTQNELSQHQQQAEAPCGAQQPQRQPQPQQLQPQQTSSPSNSSRQLMEQRRLVLLQQQQQEEEQLRLHMQQQEQQRAAASARAALPHEQQKQRHQVLGMLSAIVSRSFCIPNNTVQQEGLQVRQLAAILKQLHAMQCIAGGSVLVQMLTAAGLCGSSSGSGLVHAVNSNQQQSQQQQQQQQQQHHQGLPNAGDAAALLWHLSELAQLEQQRRLLVMPAATEISRAVSAGNLILATLRQAQTVPVLLELALGSRQMSSAAAATSNHDSRDAAAVDVHTICVALAAVAQLAAAVDAAEAAARTAAAAAADATADQASLQQEGTGGTSAAFGAAAASRIGPATISGVGGVGSRSAAFAAALAGHHRVAMPAVYTGIAALGVTADRIQQLLDILLALARQQQQQQRRQQRLGKPEAISALDNAVKLWHHLVQHSQQQRQSWPQGQKGTPTAVPQQQQGQEQQQKGQQYMANWVSGFATAVLPQLKICSPETLTQLLTLLSDRSLNIRHMPGHWLSTVEARVLYHVRNLCGKTDCNKAKPEPAVKLLHAWVSLLLQLEQQQAAVQHNAAAAAAAAANSGGLPGDSRDVAQEPARRSAVCTAGVSAGFSAEAAATLQAHIGNMDPQTLGQAAWAVATLGLRNPGPWLQQLLPAISTLVSAAWTATKPSRASRASSSTAQLAAATMLAIPLPAAAAYGVPAAVAATVPATPATATTTAAGHDSSSSKQLGKPPVPLTPQALLDILQSLLLLRCRPPIPLLQKALALAQRDMLAYAKGSELVGLLLVLVQLRVRPGTEWMRAVLLRTQGKLRMLSFDELTQLCWCLAQMGVVPSQQWQDDFADTSAGHVIPWKQNLKQRQRQEQQMHGSVSPQLPGQPNYSRTDRNISRSSYSLAAAAADVAAAKPAEDRVHTWQLMVMCWAFACWGYRPGHAVGKLQYRLLRELNSVAWGVQAQKLQWQQYIKLEQQGHRLNVQQKQELEAVKLSQKVRRQRHMQLKLLRYYRRRRMSTSWQIAAADAASRWTPKGHTSSHANSSTTSTADSMAGPQRLAEQELDGQPQQQQQQRLWGWGKLLRHQRVRRQRTRRDAKKLIVCQMRWRAAAVWPEQWKLVSLESQQSEQ